MEYSKVFNKEFTPAHAEDRFTTKDPAFWLSKQKATVPFNSAMEGKFKELISALFSSKDITSTHYSLQQFICIVNVGTSYCFTIPAHLLAVIDEVFLTTLLEKWIENHPVKARKCQFCFVSELLGFKELFEMTHRIYTLFLEPAYYQMVDVVYNVEDRNFNAYINGSTFIVSSSALNDTDALSEKTDDFIEWVERTQECSLIEGFVL